MANVGTERGSRTRARIVNASAALLLSAGPNPASAPTVTEIAHAAGVYPNQITHHFGSKDRLIVDAAFSLFLRDTARLQTAGRRAPSAHAFREVLARAAMVMPSAPILVRAMVASDPQSRQRTAQLLAVVFARSEQYLAQVCAERGWTSRQGVSKDARTFWSTALGATLLRQSGAEGGPSEVDLAATLTID